VGQVCLLLGIAAFTILFPGIAQQEKREPQEKQLPAAPLPRGKKLILKDGSYHLVRSYEQKGDRVRYYSVERSAWEELPADLVDWEATRRADAEEEERGKVAVEKLRAAQAAARAEGIDVDASVEIAPGKFLPDGEGLWALDAGLLLPMSQLGADVKLDKGRLLTQVLVGIPLIPTKHRVRIAGKAAVLRLTSPHPEFYIRVADDHEPEMELIRAQVKGNMREIEAISTDIVGQQRETRNTISTQRWRVARNVYRITLSQSLDPGEYVIAEILPDQGMGMFVWDFGVDLPGTKPTKK
jgi:hypothetical protein